MSDGRPVHMRGPIYVVRRGRAVFVPGNPYICTTRPLRGRWTRDTKLVTCKRCLSALKHEPL